MERQYLLILVIIPIIIVAGLVLLFIPVAEIGPGTSADCFKLSRALEAGLRESLDQQGPENSKKGEISLPDCFDEENLPGQKVVLSADEQTDNYSTGVTVNPGAFEFKADFGFEDLRFRCNVEKPEINCTENKLEIGENYSGDLKFMWETSERFMSGKVLWIKVKETSN